MGDNITNQDIVARSVMERGGVALKREIVSDTGLTPNQVRMARDRLVQRGLFTNQTLRRDTEEKYDDFNYTGKSKNQFIGFRMRVIKNPRVTVRINKLLKKFEVGNGHKN